MEYIVGLIVLIFMLMVDSRLNKIHKELMLLNRGLAYICGAAPKPANHVKPPEV